MRPDAGVQEPPQDIAPTAEASDPPGGDASPADASDTLTEALEVLDVAGDYIAENWAFVLFGVYFGCIIAITEVTKGLLRGLFAILYFRDIEDEDLRAKRSADLARPLVAALPTTLGGVSGYLVIPLITANVPWMYADGVIAIMLGVGSGWFSQVLWDAYKTGRMGRVLATAAELTLMLPIKWPAGLERAIHDLTLRGRQPFDPKRLEELEAIGTVRTREVEDDEGVARTAIVIWPHPEAEDGDGS